MGENAEKFAWAGITVSLPGSSSGPRLVPVTVRAVELLADAVRPLQSGDVNLYLLYVFLVILLAYLLGAV